MLNDASTSHAKAPPSCSALGADDPWAGDEDAARCMASIFTGFKNLGLRSAGFAARLVYAGALSALGRLADKQREHCRRAAGPGAGAGAGGAMDAAMASIARDIEALACTECFAVFASAVPRVSRRALCC